MDYEKKDSENTAVKTIMRMIADGEISQEVAEKYFPELKESEDERIRKTLIAVVNLYYGEGEDEEKTACLYWLEKQGEQKFEQKFFINDKVVHKATRKIWTIHHYLKDTNSYYVEDNDGLLHHYRENELKLVEQKPADKIEPKFKVGQTIKKEGFNLGFTISKIEDGFYYNDEGDCFPFTDQDNWEIVEQKPAEWSKYDNDMMRNIIDDIHCGTDFNPKVMHAANEREKWFKSICLRCQNQWKPNEEQLNALKEQCVNLKSTHSGSILCELYNKLKKL